RPEIDEDGNEIDLQKDLVDKLIVYKQFKELCENLREVENKRWQWHRRGNIAFDLQLATKNAPASSDELDSIDLYKLMMVYERLMYKYENRQTEARHTVTKYPYTIEE